MAHPKHESVRVRYRYQCGYCGVSEVDAGGERTVDHYRPVSAGGDDVDANLVVVQEQPMGRRGASQMTRTKQKNGTTPEPVHPSQDVLDLSLSDRSIPSLLPEDEAMFEDISRSPASLEVKVDTSYIERASAPPSYLPSFQMTDALRETYRCMSDMGFPVKIEIEEDEE